MAPRPRPGGRRSRPYVSGLLVEYFEQAGSDKVLFYNDPNNWHGYWESWLGLVDVAQNAGVDFYGGMKGSATDTGKMMYGKASFLLKWNGKGGGFFWQMNDDRQRPLERRLDDRHRHPHRRALPGRRRLAQELHRRHRARQPQPHHRPDLQPRRHLQNPQRHQRHHRHPPTHHRHDPHRRVDNDTAADHDDNDDDDDNDDVNDNGTGESQPADDRWVPRRRGRR